MIISELREELKYYKEELSKYKEDFLEFREGLSEYESKLSNHHECENLANHENTENVQLVSYIDRNNNNFKYYEIIKMRDKNGKLHRKRKLLKKDDEQRLLTIASRTYQMHVVEDLKNNIAIIETFLKKYNVRSPGTNYLNDNPGILKLLREVENSSEQQDCDFISEDAWMWARDEYPTNPKYRDQRKFETLDGHKVDSKSEILICDELYRKGIPYRYGCAFKTRNGLTIYPDFMFKNSAKDEYVIWEHFGRMFDLQYVHEAAEKFRWYGELGYYPSHRLIMTFESENSLDSATVARVIKEYFGI